MDQEVVQYSAQTQKDLQLAMQNIEFHGDPDRSWAVVLRRIWMIDRHADQELLDDLHFRNILDLEFDELSKRLAGSGWSSEVNIVSPDHIVASIETDSWIISYSSHSRFAMMSEKISV